MRSVHRGVFLALWAVAGAAAPQGPSHYQVTVDVPAALGPVTVEGADVADFDTASMTFLALHTLAAILPAGVDVDGITCFANGDIAFSTDTSFIWSGGTAEDEDVLLLSGGNLTLLLNGSAVGIPADADLDALHVLRISPPAILFSLDRDETIQGTTYADEDIIRFDSSGTTFFLELAGSSWLGADAGRADVDGLAMVRTGTTTLYYLSTDVSVTVPGLGTADDGDIVTCSGATGNATAILDLGPAAGFPDIRADLDGLDVQTPPGLGQGAIDRQIVNTATVVTWSVVYTDPDDDGPSAGSPTVSVDGGAAATLFRDNSGCGTLCDGTFSNGERYLGTGTVGYGQTHTFAFAGTDGIDAVSTTAQPGPSFVSDPGDADGDRDHDATDIALVLVENFDGNGGPDLDLVRGGTFTDTWGGADGDSDHAIGPADLPAAASAAY